jgi:hypothetical protein
VAGQGGAIFATARLDLTDVKVADSAASISKAGADALAAGGGIYTTGRLNLNQSIVTGNSATATNTGTGAGEDAVASGGGIFLNAPDATATAHPSPTRPPPSPATRSSWTTARSAATSPIQLRAVAALPTRAAGST